MNLNLAQQLFREQESRAPVSSFLLLLVFTITIAVFGQVALAANYSRDTGIEQLLLLFFGAMVVLGLKQVLYRLVAGLFPFGETVRFFSFNFFLILKMAGIALLPLLFIAAFAALPVAKLAYYGAIGLLGLAVLLLAYRGFKMGKGYLYLRKYHFLMYLCALEIAPVFLIVKAFEFFIMGSL